MAAAPSAASLALNNPSSGKIDQQRKILEELERQKKQLSKGNSAAANLASTAAATAPPAVVAAANNPPPQNSSAAPATAAVPGAAPVTTTNLIDPCASPLLSANQRNALEAAAKSSFGYFIAQDSAFGNTILPVIPRFTPAALASREGGKS